jgi:hypothetical protein
MEIHFTIGWAWVEFFCHFFAAFLYMAAGYDMTKDDYTGFYLMIIAMSLTAFGASL